MRGEIRVAHSDGAVHDGHEVFDKGTVGRGSDESLMVVQGVPVCAVSSVGFCRLGERKGTSWAGWGLGTDFNLSEPKYEPMKSWSTLWFSTSRPQYARWKPSCCDTVDMVVAHTFPAGEPGSSTEAPAVRGMVASSVAAGAIILWVGVGEVVGLWSDGHS